MSDIEKSNGQSQSLNVLVACVTIVILAIVAGLTIFNLNDRKLMADNINSAIEKGVDPMSVRCSYASSQDLICVAFAASSGSHSVQSPLVKK